MNRFRDLSLGIKINLVIIIAVIILAILILAAQVLSTNALLDEIGQFNITEETVVIESRLIEIQEDIETAATVIVNTPGLTDAIINIDVNSLRTLYLSAAPSLGIDTFNVVDAEGLRLFTTQVNNEITEQDDELVNQVLLGIQRTTIVAQEQNNGVLLRAISLRSIRDDEGTILGGILLSRELTDEMLAVINFERQGIELSLIYEMVTIAESSNQDHEILLQPNLVSQALSGNVASNDEIIYSSEGIPYNEVYLPLQGLDDRFPIATIAVRIDNRSIATFQSELLRNSGTILVLAALLATVTVITIVYFTVTRRIDILKETAVSFARGEYSKTLDIQGEDEIGELAKTFRSMADDIQKRQNELKELNQSLEKRVSDRTIELKEARDEAVVAKQIADENSQLKSEFLSMMSHELRTPMNAIEGFTGIILKRMAGTDYNDKTERYLLKVKSNSQRLLGLINDFLDLSRIESGRLELAYLPIEPEKMVQFWYSIVSVLADNKDLDFVVDVDPNLPETIYGDEESLTKIAVNLIGNAIKFTENGQVSVKLEKIDEKMMLQVSDTGVGIPPHAREFIFDEFRQVDMTSKRQHGGTGLGLAIVNKLAKAMGGTVTLQSEVGVGSTFTVSIPIHTQPLTE